MMLEVLLFYLDFDYKFMIEDKLDLLMAIL